MHWLVESAIDFKTKPEGHSIIETRPGTTEVFILVARTQDQLDEILSLTMDEERRGEFYSTYPELRAGLPDDDMMIFMISLGSAWRVFIDETTYNEDQNRLTVTYIEGGAKDVDDEYLAFAVEKTEQSLKVVRNFTARRKTVTLCSIQPQERATLQ